LRQHWIGSKREKRGEWKRGKEKEDEMKVGRKRESKEEGKKRGERET